ncbi:EAL domain protein [mine drainage metagenome]|uniref:EAL domain protein n=1 Tax=mine drainage metagenome TaxID=410659 RepID=A0A1J5SD58_9ZZZZ
MLPPREDPPLSAQQRAIAQRLVGQENLLVDYVQKLDKHRRGRQAVVIKLSGLQAVNRREHHIRIALSGFEPLIRQLKGQVFSLTNSDIVFIFRETAREEVEAALVKLRFLFGDDPLLADEGYAGKASFINWYLLERDYDALLQVVKQAAADEEQRRALERTKTAMAQTPAVRLQGRGDPLTPDMLAKIEDALVRADLGNMMRRQAICAIIGKVAPQPVYYELFISIADLRSTILPNVNLASSPWLFQQLTETLDKRVLALLNKHDDRTIAGDISINLNVQTLLSPEFLVFDDNLKASMRGTIVLELQKVDVFADLGAFLFARDFAHDRGYRICIDGVTMENLPFVDRERLGVDLVKVIWDPAMLDGMMPGGGSLERYFRICGPSRSILCRCDEQEAIDWGQSVGITLFQGRHVEALLAAEQVRLRGLAARRR